MAENLSSDKVAAFMDVVRSINTALRNSAMYPAGHPMLTASVKSLKAALDGWLGSGGKLDMAFSRSAILLGGKPVKEGNPVLAGLADHFHQRGLLALTIRPGITAPEVSALLAAIKDPPEVIAQSGGISAKLRLCPHLIVKQIDYSTLLARGGSQAGGASDVNLVQILCDAEKGARAGILSAATVEGMSAALAGEKKFAAAVNEMFAPPAGRRGEAAKNIWRVTGRVVRLCKGAPSEKAAETLRHLSAVLAELKPEALAALFGEQAAEEGMDDLQRMALQAIPDERLSEMITAHITREGQVDGSLMNIFMRLSARAGASSGLAQSVAKKLSGLDHDRLATVQGALEDALKTAAKNEFMSQVYQLTVDSLAEKSRATIATDGVVATLVSNYEKLRDPARVDEEKIMLLLNILWFEDDPGSFREFSGKLLDTLSRCREEIRSSMALDALRVFWEKTRPGTYPAIVREAVSGLRRAGPIAGPRALVSLIPVSSQTQLEEIGSLLSANEAESEQALLDLLFSGDDREVGPKISLALAFMKPSAGRVEEMARAIGRERNIETRRATLRMLAESRDKTVLENLFAFFAGPLAPHRILPELVEECGRGRVAEAVPFIAGLLNRYSMPVPGRARVVQTAVESLCHIRSPEAAAVLQKCIHEKNRTVELACKKIMQETEGAVSS
ncbi:MAG: hypothetical protein AB7T27_09780 [Kiritimatiellia bacterium]